MASYDRPKQLQVLLGTHPAVSMCCLRWIGLLLGEAGMILNSKCFYKKVSVFIFE